MNLPEIELDILKWWRENKIFEKSTKKSAPRGDFVFYEGPPTANGKPGIHHVLARAFKDIIPRFKTMQGYRVVRKAGWDTHGLPVELEVEKQLGLKNKKEVDAYGIAAFNQKCKESVWKYKDDWEKLTARMGFWVDMEHPYVTYTAPYVEALWGVIKLFHKRGLLIEGHKVVPHCPRCGTALSSHELALGYQTVKDVSLTVKFPISNFQFSNKSQFSNDQNAKVYILSWTTTPWTLPGNVALAVGNDIEYVAVKVAPSRHPERAQRDEGSLANANRHTPGMLRQSFDSAQDDIAQHDMSNAEYLILAKDRLGILDGEYEVIAELKGSELVGLEYEPLFDIPALKSPESYKVYPADFVSTTDGTGVVHTAVMYGEDDYNLGTAVGLPKIHTVDEAGLFNANAPEFVRGKFVKDKETEKLIIDDLEKRGLIFKEEFYEHDYPFCWRCKTPLLYYAKHSWFVAMSKLRNELIKANDQINWVPSYIKEGRFGEWLREVKDWAFSRERYWGTPLPIWRCQGGKSQIPNSKFQTNPNDQNSNLMVRQAHHDNRHPDRSGGIPRQARDDNQCCGRVEVIGSVAELVQRAQLKNRYIFMRHGRAVSNVNDLCNGSVEASQQYPMVEEGIAQIKTAITFLKDENIDAIYSSDFLRTQQTAEMIAKERGLDVHYDARIREYAIGEYEGKPVAEYNAEFPNTKARFLNKPEGGETYGEILVRMVDFIKELERRYKGNTFLVVTHGDPLWILLWTLAGSPGALDAYPYPVKGNPVIVDHGVFLTDERGELDLHRPRADEVEFPCQCGGLMRRVPEVADVWFDSGAMPFAQYPHNIITLINADNTRINADLVDNSSASIRVGNLRESALWQFPADYISEAIDQTRGWFYTLLAVSVALGKGAPYRNVICLGHILDAKGKKMSKSLGNIIVPEEVFAKYGADAVRWHLFTVNDPGLPKRFDEKEIMEIVKKFFMILWNVVSFHELYPPLENPKSQILNPKQTQNSKFQFPNSVHVLDRWIMARLNQLIGFVTERLEAYDITPAGRAIEEFVTDLSTWYVRRSRERMKTGSEGRVVLRHVLTEFSKLIAPFIPFTAEALWQKIQGTKNKEHESVGSVHLADWPQAGEIDPEVLAYMDTVRKVVEAGLAARAAAKIPVRQPLQRASIKNQESGIKDEYADILKDELNVKEVVFEKSAGPLSVELDTHLTEELRLEGMKRELIRAVNNLRKEAKLTIKDQIVLSVQKTPISEQLINFYIKDLLKATISSEVRLVEEVAATRHAQVKLGEEDIKFGF